MKITPPKNQGLQIKQDVQKSSGSEAENIGGAQSLRAAAAITEHGFTASVQEVNAIENLFVFEIVKRRKMEDDGPAAKGAEQTNALSERAFSQPAMGEVPYFGMGIWVLHPSRARFPSPGPAEE